MNQKAQAKANKRFAAIVKELDELKASGEKAYVKAKLEGKTPEEADGWTWYFQEKLKPLKDLSDEELMAKLYEEALAEVATPEEFIAHIRQAS